MGLGSFGNLKVFGASHMAGCRRPRPSAPLSDVRPRRSCGALTQLSGRELPAVCTETLAGESGQLENYCADGSIAEGRDLATPAEYNHSVLLRVKQTYWVR
jgi:hypothetical protein